MKKSTKKSLLFSILALILCTAMLLGTTFAWFTDSASTAVNKIQAGTLDVALEMKNAEGSWVNAEGETLQFKVNGRIPAEGTQILWEPGCTYELPELRIVNKGNLALKYKMIVNGIVGNAKLLDAITFTYGDGIDITQEVILTPGERKEGIVIQGHMKEEAGNEYQGLSIDSVGITVMATQASHEFDSFNNTYDGDAFTPVNATATGNLNVSQTTAEGQTAPVTVKTEQTISGGIMTVTYPDGAKLASSTAVDGTGDNQKATVAQKLEYKGDTPSAELQATGVDIGDDKAVAHYELTLPVADDNDQPVTIKIKYATGLSGVKVYHSGIELTATANANGESFAYNPTTGELTLVLKHASPIDIVNNVVMPAGAKMVMTAEELQAELDAGTAYIVLGANIDTSELGGSEWALALKDTVIDLNGHTVSGAISTGSWMSDASGARVTLKDSAGGGQIYSKFRLVKGAMMQANAVSSWKQAVTIDGGTYLSNNAVINCQVQNSDPAEGVIINGGTFKGSNDLIDGVDGLPGPVGGCVSAVIGTVTINGGTFDAAQYGSVIMAESGSSNVDTVVNIHGGTFSGACMFDFGRDHSSKSIINVYGGTFTVENPDGSATITATSFAYDNYTGAALVNNDMFQLNIMGGTFNYDPSSYVDTANYNITNNGSTWTVTAK